MPVYCNAADLAAVVEEKIVTMLLAGVARALHAAPVWRRARSVVVEC